MLQLIARGLLAGFLVVSVTEIARWSTRLGAVLLFVPIAIPVVFLIMYMRDGSLAAISHMSRQALVLIPLSLPMFVPMALAQRLGLSFWGALAVGLALACVTIAGYLWLS